jgi:hypothetical protein
MSPPAGLEGGEKEMGGKGKGGWNDPQYDYDGINASSHQHSSSILPPPTTMIMQDLSSLAAGTKDPLDSPEGSSVIISQPQPITQQSSSSSSSHSNHHPQPSLSASQLQQAKATPSSLSGGEDDLIAPENAIPKFSLTMATANNQDNNQSQMNNNGNDKQSMTSNAIQSLLSRLTNRQGVTTLSNYGDNDDLLLRNSQYGIHSNGRCK